VLLTDVNDPPSFSESSFYVSVAENTDVGTELATSLAAIDQESNTQSLSYTVKGANCWAGTSTGTVDWVGETLAKYGEGSVVYRVSTGRYPVIYYSESTSTGDSYYKISVGQQQTSRRTKLVRCDSGASCRTKQDVDTGDALTFLSTEITAFWITQVSTLRSGYEMPDWRGFTSPGRFLGTADSTALVNAGAEDLGNSARTMMGWVKSTDPRGGIPFSFGVSPSAQCNLGFAIDLKADNFDVLGGCEQNTDADMLGSGVEYSAVDGEWYHVAVVYSAGSDKELTVYIDGEHVGSGTAPNPYSTKGGYTIGSWSDNNRHWQGEIRDVRFYHVALSSTAVRDAMLSMDYEVSFVVGTGEDPTDDDTVVTTLVDTASTRAPPVVSTIGLGAEAGASTVYHSVCFDGSNPISTDVLVLGGQTAKLTVNGLLDYEVKNEYSFLISVSDSGTPRYSDEAVVYVSVRDVNEPPVFLPSGTCGSGDSSFVACFDIAEDAEEDAEIGTILVVDQDEGQSVTMSIVSGNLRDTFELDARTGVLSLKTPTLDFEDGVFNELALTISARDSDRNDPETIETRIKVTATDVNESPMMEDAGREVPENSDVGVTVGDPYVGTDVDDGDWGTLTYEITGGTGAALFSIDSETGQIEVASATLDHEEQDTYTIVVTGTDGGELSAEGTVTISVTDVNEPPTINDASREIAENSPVGDPVGEALEASDPDADQSLTYTIIDGNEEELFRIGRCSGRLEIVQAKLDHERRDQYQLTVMVTDDGLNPARLSDTATITIDILDVNEPPVFEGGNLLVEENSEEDSEVGDALTASDVDAGQTLTFTISGGDGDGIFAISEDGQVTVAKPELDYETQLEYSLVVRVTDDGDNPEPLYTEATVTVQLLDVNEAPVIRSQTVSVDENSPAGTMVSPNLVATDVDAGDISTFAVVGGSDDLFELAGTSLRVMSGAELDHENVDEYSVTVRVTDSGGLTDEAVVTVLINDVNEAPELEDVTLYVDENSDIGATVGELSATDPDEGQSLTFAFVTGIGISDVEEFAFKSSAPDTLEVRQAVLDYETEDSYEFRVRVSDNGSPQLSTVVVVTVMLNDVNEPPVISSETPELYVSEGVDCDLDDTDPDNEVIVCENVGEPLVAVDHDEGDVVSWSIIGGDGADMFTIEESTGQIKVAPCADFDLPDHNCLDFETTPEYSLEVRASDDEDAGSSHTFTIHVEDANERPHIADQTRTLQEREPAATAFGGGLVASDVDAGSILSFVIGPCYYEPGEEIDPICDPSVMLGNDDGMFGIDVATGQLYLADPSPARYDVGEVITLAVLVYDQELATDAANITITITNRNDPPVIVPETFDVPENSPSGTVITSELQFSDADGDTVTLELIKTAPAAGFDLFALDTSTGEITFTGEVGQLNFEVTDEYQLQVGGSDHLGAEGVAWITVRVTDVNEAPMLSLAEMAVYENVGVGLAEGELVPIGNPLAGTDVDTADVLSYQLAPVGESEDTAPFSISASGQISVIAASLDYETQTVYHFFANVSDGSLSATAGVTIYVMNVNEPPRASSVSVTVPESLAIGSSPAQVVAEDDDAADSQTSRQTELAFEISDNNAFAIDNRGVITVVGVVDYENVATYELTVTVSDNGVDGPVLDTTVSVTIAVEDANDVTIVGFSSTGDANDVGIVAPFRTVGGDEIFIHGTNFGPTRVPDLDSLPTIDATYGPTGVEYAATGCRACYIKQVYDQETAQERTVTRCNDRSTSDKEQDNTIVVCRTVEGTGQGHKWIITVNNNDHTPPQTNGGAGNATSAAKTTYQAPEITSILNATAMPTTGHQLVTLTGTNFGPAGRTFIQLFYGPTEGLGYSSLPGSCSVLTAHTQVTCYTSPGVGTDLGFVVEVDGLRSAYHTGGYSFDQPTVWYVLGESEMHTAGGEVVVITGENFGAATGIGAGAGVPGLEGGLVASYSNEDNADDPYIAVGCMVTKPHTEVTCRTAPGIGRDYTWTLHVGGRASVFDGSTMPDGAFRVSSYMRPVVMAVGGPGAFGGATEGGQEVYITGREFGPRTPVDSDDVRAWYGADPLDPATRREAGGCRVSVANLQITCTTVPGTGKDHSWYVEVGEQPSNVNDAKTFYAPPVLTTFRGPGATFAATPGEELVIIEGKQFGPADPNPIDYATYGINGNDYQATNCSVTVDHVEIMCTTAAGAGAGLKWIVYIDGQASGVPTTNYAPPSVETISGAGASESGASTNGGELVVISGQNFGPSDSVVKELYNTTYLDGVTYGPTGQEYAAQGCVVDGHSQVTCETAPGVGEFLVWRMQIRGQSSPLYSFTRYAPPHIETVSPLTFPTNGGTVITIEGTNFGLADPAATVMVKFDDQTLEIIEPLPNDRGIVSFHTPAGQGANKTLYLEVTAHDQTVVSNEFVVHYQSAHIDRVVPEKGLTEESRHLVVEGVNFGLEGQVYVQSVRGETEEDQEVVVEHIPTAIWDHTRVELDFNGKAGTLWIVVDGVKTNEVSFEHLAPVLSGLCGDQGELPMFNTAGGDTFRMRGENLGADKELVKVTIGGSPCPVERIIVITDKDIIEEDADCPVTAQYNEDMEIIPVYEIECTVPPGIGIDRYVYVSFLGQESTAAVVSYRPPEIEEVQPRDLPTEGGVAVVISGSNFGNADVELSLELSGKFEDCVHSHTQITCVSPEGAGKELSGTLRVNNESNPFIIGQDAAWPDHLRMSFFPPTISEVRIEEDGILTESAVNSVPTEGARIWVYGTNFGPSISGAPTVTLGGEDNKPAFDCAIHNWTHTIIVCDVEEGEGAELDIIVEAGGQASAEAHSFGYDKPIVLGIWPNHGPTQGGEMVHVWGQNFGRGSDYGRAFVGTFFPNSTLVHSFNHTDIIFTLPEGSDAGLIVRVGAGQQLSENDDVVFNYDAPELFYADIEEKGIPRDDMATVGGAKITLHGTSMGRSRGEVFLRGYGTGRLLSGSLYNEYTVVDSDELILHTHTMVSFTMPEGMGTDVEVSLVVGGRASEGERVVLHYRSPELQSVSPNRANSRGDRVSLMGLDFGETANQSISVYVGGKECLDIKYEPRISAFNHPYVSCTSVADRVGYKPIEIRTAMQSDSAKGMCVDESKCGLLFTMCDIGSYGQEGEWCLDCPRGAECEGDVAEPVSVRGFWLQNGTDILCPDIDSEEGQAIVAYVNATDRYYAGERPVTHVKVDEDDNLVEYMRVEELCQDHPIECGKTWCTRIWRGERQDVPMAVPCDPSIACRGGNLCSRGYDGERCASCDKCYKVNPDDPDEECIRFRPLDSGECEQCPEEFLLLMRIIGFSALAIFLCIGGWAMNKYNVHLAFISIGVDYFQILAIFRNSRVQWPPMIKELFRMMAIFNLNLDIAAPECLFDIDYANKWIFIEILPVFMLVVFILGHVYQYVLKKYIRQRARGLYSHLAGYAAAYLVMFYYLYLYLTRTLLSVFNCAPTDPYDGFTYLQVGDQVERCWEDGGLHMQLLPMAVICLLAYTIGYPVVVAQLLVRNKMLIMEDQLLRARGEGDKRIENPNAYDIRQRYHKVYYHFKPDYYYWVLAVIGRKFLIAFTALMFNRNPAFQLSCALLVIFCSYALQVKHKPYMSVSDREEVLQDHAEKAKEGGVHARLAANIGAVIKQGRKTTRSVGMGTSSNQQKALFAAQQARSFFFNYNTVEAVLLFCAALVCLCGVMFESGQFESDYYQEQRDTVTGLVLFVIFFSVVYFMVVFISEMRATLCPKKVDEKKLRKDAMKKRQSMSGRNFELGAVGPVASAGAAAAPADQQSLNPLFAADSSGGADGTSSGDTATLMADEKPPNKAQWAAIRGVMQSTLSEVETLQRDLAMARKALKKAEAKAESGSTPRRARKPSLAKRDFAPTRSGGEWSSTQAAAAAARATGAVSRGGGVWGGRGRGRGRGGAFSM